MKGRRIMHDDREELKLIGQFAGIVAVMSAVIKALPPSTRKRLLRQTQAEFESLLAAMSASAESQTAREGAEWIRDLFVKRIVQADAKSKSSRTPKRPADSRSRTAQDKRSQQLDRPLSTDVDFEL